MFEVGEPLRLSDLMPMLSNFGITVISEEADELRIDSAGADRARLRPVVSRAGRPRRGAGEHERRGDGWPRR